MSLDIEVRTREILHYVGLPMSARLAEFGAPGGPNEAVPRVFAWLAEHNIAPAAGPLFVYRHMGKPGDPVGLTVGVPIAEPVRPAGEMVLGYLPPGTYVVARHVGAPDQIPDSHARVRDWADAKGLRLDPLPRDGGEQWTGHAEHFLTNPAEEPDPEQWVTELLFKTTGDVQEDEMRRPHTIGG